MITATRILSAGSWTGPAADTLVLDRDDRHRRRLVMRCTGKTVFLLDLPEARVLKDGDALELEDGRLVAVKAVPERLLEVTAETPAALVRIAYHLGNRHLPVEFQGERLLIREDHVIEAMLGGRPLLDFWDRMLSRIPGVGVLYGSTKSFGEALFTGRETAFKQVVLVPWPSPGIYRIGFVPARPDPEVSRRLGAEVEVVFVPHTPNPASGFVHYVPRTQVIHLDWTVEEALKVIVSGSVLQPADEAGAGGSAEESCGPRPQ